MIEYENVKAEILPGQNKVVTRCSRYHLHWPFDDLGNLSRDEIDPEIEPHAAMAHWRAGSRVLESNIEALGIKRPKFPILDFM